MQYLALVSIAIVAVGCGSDRQSEAQSPAIKPADQEAIATEQSPASIVVEPETFRIGQLIEVTAKLAAPDVCQDHGYFVRLYDVETLDGKPTFDSKYLAQSPASVNPSGPIGTQVEILFERFSVPREAGNKLYLAAWSWCGVKLGMDTQKENIIVTDKGTGELLATASFHSECGAAQDNALCSYRRD
jgi:hypothetical protein